MPKPPANNNGKIPLLVKGDKRIGSAGFWNKLIRTANAFRSLRVVRGAQDAFVIGDDNAVLSLVETLGGSGAGVWKWANPKEYSAAKVYFENEVVLVSQGNASVPPAIAGLYVALQQVPVNTFPVWPLPNASISNAANFWMLISFYPITATWCVAGVNTHYYIHAQRVP